MYEADIYHIFLPVNVNAHGIFPSLPCPNPKYCACPGYIGFLVIVAKGELFGMGNILLTWLISVYMIQSVFCVTMLKWEWELTDWARDGSHTGCINGLAGCQSGPRWLLLDDWPYKVTEKVRGFAASNSRRITRPDAVGNRTKN